MDFNKLITMQYEKVTQIENYKRTHTPDTQLTKDTYRAVSLAYMTMLTHQKLHHDGKIIQPAQHKQLSQQMSHSLELYNEWLKTSTMSPPHTKSKETVPKIHESIIKGWLNQLQEYNQQITKYMNQQSSKSDNDTKQLMLSIRNTILQLDYYHGVSQKNPTNITDQNIRQMQAMYAEALARHQKWRSRIGLSVSQPKQNMYFVPAHNSSPQSRAVAGYGAGLHHQAMQHHNMRMHPTPPQRQQGLQMHQMQHPRPPGLYVVNPQSGGFHVHPNPQLHHQHQFNQRHRPPGGLPVYPPNQHVYRNTGAFHAHPQNHLQHQQRFSPHRPSDGNPVNQPHHQVHRQIPHNLNVKVVTHRDKYGNHVPDTHLYGTITGVPDHNQAKPSSEQMRAPTDSDSYGNHVPDTRLYDTVIGVPDPNQAKPSSQHMHTPTTPDTRNPQALVVHRVKRPRSGLNGAHMNPYTIDTISE